MVNKYSVNIAMFISFKLMFIFEIKRILPFPLLASCPCHTTSILDPGVPVLLLKLFTAYPGVIWASILTWHIPLHFSQNWPRYTPTCSSSDQMR